MISSKERVEIYREAVKQWGVDAQLNMVVEELGELIVVLQHSRRLEKWEKVADNNEVAEEIADVELMLAQLKFILSIDNLALDYIKERKLSRLKELLNLTSVPEEVTHEQSH